MTTHLGPFLANGFVLLHVQSVVKWKYNSWISKMEKLYKDAEETIRNFKLDYCCWFAPVRVGIYIIGWLNLVADVVSLIGTTNDSLSPIIFKIQEIILEDLASKLVPLLAYSTEMCFTILLLCGLYRNDIVLLRYYIYYTIATVVMAFLVYSMVISKLDVLLIIGIVFSFILQIYMILLVRSAIVEIKSRKQDNNGIVHFNVAEEKIKEISIKCDVETPSSTPLPPLPETEGSVGPEGRLSPPPKEHYETRLETVNEDPKESSSEKVDENSKSTTGIRIPLK